jgi:hypothetical protein
MDGFFCFSQLVLVLFVKLSCDLAVTRFDCQSQLLSDSLTPSFASLHVSQPSREGLSRGMVLLGPLKRQTPHHSWERWGVAERAWRSRKVELRNLSGKGDCPAKDSLLRMSCCLFWKPSTLG